MRHPLSLPDDQADMDYAYSLIDRGLLPDFVLRPAVRALCNSRLREIDNGSLEGELCVNRADRPLISVLQRTMLLRCSLLKVSRVARQR